MKRALLPLLTGMTLLLGQGCGSIPTQGNDGGGGASGAGQAGRGAAGSGGSTGSAGAGGHSGAGGQGGGVACGPVTCSAGLYCCNAPCGICAPPGAACVQGCPVGGQGGGTAGTSGQGGAGGGATCAELVSDYTAAMTPARACTPGAMGQCQVLVSDTLSYCLGCSTYVNDATKLDAIRSQWTNQGCAVPTPCQGACILPGPISCVASDSGSPGGTCTITPATTN